MRIGLDTLAENQTRSVDQTRVEMWFNIHVNRTGCFAPVGDEVSKIAKESGSVKGMATIPVLLRGTLGTIDDSVEMVSSSINSFCPVGIQMMLESAKKFDPRNDTGRCTKPSVNPIEGTSSRCLKTPVSRRKASGAASKSRLVTAMAAVVLFATRCAYAQEQPECASGCCVAGVFGTERTAVAARRARWEPTMTTRTHPRRALRAPLARTRTRWGRRSVLERVMPEATLHRARALWRIASSAPPARMTVTRTHPRRALHACRARTQTWSGRLRARRVTMERGRRPERPNAPWFNRLSDYRCRRTWYRRRSLHCSSAQTSSRGVTSGDWNGDGLMDAMVVNYGSENEILISDGQGGFTSTLLERTDNSRGVTSGDWNGDGLMDAMVVNSGSENEILISDGQGGFTSTLLERTDDSYGVTSGDWNGDGLMDAMVVNYGSENEILISDGQGGFTSTLLERTDVSLGVTSGDWNGDGLMDAMVANHGSENEILISDGQGGFTSTLLERTDSSRGVTSGDWNGDGLMDAMVVNLMVRERNPDIGWARRLHLHVARAHRQLTRRDIG